MTVTGDTTAATKVYDAPGRPGSVVTLKPRYDNFIGGHWVPPPKASTWWTCHRPTPVSSVRSLVPRPRMSRWLSMQLMRRRRRGARRP